MSGRTYTDLASAGWRAREFDQWAKFRHFRLAIAIAEHGSIIHAARTLNYAQSMASKQLSELERSLGCKLFTRNNQGAAPTAFGEEFIRHGRVILAQLAVTTKRLDALASGAEGRIVIGVASATSLPLLSTSLTALKRRDPGVRIVIVEDAIERLAPRLISGELDLVIGAMSASCAEIEGEVLCRDDLCVAARHGHPLAGAPLSLERLAAADWILPPREAGLRGRIERAFQDAGLPPPEPRVESLSAQANRQLMLTTDLVGVCSRIAIHGSGPGDRLTALDVDLALDGEPISLLWRERGGLSPVAMALSRRLRTAAIKLNRTPAPILDQALKRKS